MTQAQQTTTASSNNDCFHVDTVISFMNERETKTLADLQQHSSGCRIPHMVQVDGLKFSTSCLKAQPLRLTKKHLVFTQRGLVAADQLTVGDFVYQNFLETDSCEITQIEEEHNQEYFGLNCAGVNNQVVLANGFKTSVYGNLHALPALFMNYGSQVLGIDRASRWGNVLANLFHKVF
jgi:hypothetical protein